MKKTKHPEWVAIDDKGYEWALYKPGVRGSRDAYGYVQAMGRERFEVWTGAFEWVKVFRTMREAASFIQGLVK